MKKVLILGCPGSGKSTLARILAERTGLPLFYLDQMYWNSDQTAVEEKEFLNRIRDVLKQESWILDGNYFSSLKMRLSACDTILFLDVPVQVCLDGVKERCGKKREDMPWVEEEPDEEFLQFIRSFQFDTRPGMFALFEEYKDKELIVFKSREEAVQWLKQIR